MKKHIISLTIAALGMFTLTGCIEEYTPQNGAPSLEQLTNAPGAFDNLVANLTDKITGKRSYRPGSNWVYDYGYPSMFLTRDVEGQDIIPAGSNNWYSTWYEAVRYLSSGYAVSQLPYTYYYGWINDCNVVLKSGGAINYAEPDATHKHGVGIAYAMRAMFYLDLCRMYAAKPYSEDHNALTTIKADEVRTVEGASDQQRMTWEEAFAFILQDLDAAEKCLSDYHRSDKYTPDVSVVYGLKARLYLEKQDWANAEKYAKLAQEGYRVMTQEEFLSHRDGFNTPNSSWMFATRFKDTDPNIVSNDGDDSWGSVMIMENGFGGGYAQNYGGVNVIDKHLYTTIPVTDFRKKCWVDFKLDGESKGQAIKDLMEYAYIPTATHADSVERATRIYEGGVLNASYGLGGLCLKFRNLAGKTETKYEAWCVSVPLMRVEEMKLIEAEAAGMQDLARGTALLTAFAKTRDPQFVYGQHQDAYYNTSTSEFQNEVWWQRRVELWGEGFATYDIKRLNKGIIRSYPGTNHLENARWNTDKLPNWMVWTFPFTETNNNGGMTLNPDPQQPAGDSPEFVW